MVDGIGIIVGRFDPPTLGHVAWIERAAVLCSQLIIGVNGDKQAFLPLETRVQLLKESVPAEVRVEPYHGLTVNFARTHGANYLIRGIRDGVDVSGELRLARGNRLLAPELETLWLAADQPHVAMSASLVREVWIYGGDISALVPEAVCRYWESHRGTENH